MRMLCSLLLSINNFNSQQQVSTRDVNNNSQQINVSQKTIRVHHSHFGIHIQVSLIDQNKESLFDSCRDPLMECLTTEVLSCSSPHSITT